MMNSDQHAQKRSIVSFQAIKALQRKALLFVTLFMIAFASPASIKQAKAWCCFCELCVISTVSHMATETALKLVLSQEFEDTIDWFVTTLWQENLYPAMITMSMELSAMSFMNQVAIGAMLDGVTTNKTQLEIHKLKISATRDQTPAVSMCKFASLSKSLAASDAKGRFNASFLAKRAIERQIGGKSTVDGNGITANTQELITPVTDHDTRFDQFLNLYCDPRDLHNGLGVHPNCSGDRQNRDINYNMLVDTALTLNVDYTDNVVTNDEVDIMAMASNLFSDELIERKFNQFSDEKKTPQYMKFRALMAKRNIAQNSFNTIVGLKSAGSGASNFQMASVFNAVTDGSAQALQETQELVFPDLYGSGNQPNPSYYAQMDFLTQKIFQDVSFFANLYDSPANVERQYATMQALGLMQRRESYESMVRSELLTSILLELEVEDKQK
jgi:hypothetical protein